MNCSFSASSATRSAGSEHSTSSRSRPRRALEIGLALLLGGADAVQDRHRDDLVVAEQADAAHAGRDARLEFAHVGRLEADRLAVAGGEQDVVLLGQQRDADQPVVGVLFFAVVALGLAEAHRDLAGGADVGERVHAVAADGAVGGREHDVEPAPFGLVLGQRQDGRDGLALGQRQQVDHRPALARCGPPSGRRQTFSR